MQACSPVSAEQWQERDRALVLGRRSRVERLIEALDDEGSPKVCHGALKAILYAKANEVPLKHCTENQPCPST